MAEGDVDGESAWLEVGLIEGEGRGARVGFLEGEILVLKGALEGGGVLGLIVGFIDGLLVGPEDGFFEDEVEGALVGLEHDSPNTSSMVSSSQVSPIFREPTI